MANLLIASDNPGYWEDNMSDNTLPQFSPSSSSTDSESFDVNDDICDLPHVKEEPVTGGDPSWVARPRNAFIIFRCEYARRHSKLGRGVKRGTGPASEKSLSKRAGEAWHQLPREEKKRFKTLADQERSEHARLHPDYRFRPAKRILPQRIIRSRAASSSNPIKLRSEGGATVKPKSDREPPSPPASMCSVDLSDSYPQATCDSLYPSHSLSDQQRSAEPCHLTSSFLNALSCEATKGQALVPSADLNSCNPPGPLYSHLEGVLPPIPQHGKNMELCPLQHPMPKCAGAPASVLTEWDGIATDNLVTASDPKERNSPTRGICFSEDPFENVCMDMQYSPYGDSYTSHLEYLCSDVLDIYYPATVSSHPQTMFSSYFPINH